MIELSPGLLEELGEALDALEAAARDLTARKRELFPAIRARQKAVARVRAIWKQARGGKPDPPPRPLLDVIEGLAQRSRVPAEMAGAIRGRKAYADGVAEMAGAIEPDAERLRGHIAPPETEELHPDGSPVGPPAKKRARKKPAGGRTS